MTENEKLTIDEIIQHCHRTCEMHEFTAVVKGQKQEDIESKNYWEHYQVANYLEELKQYRDLGTVEGIVNLFNNQRTIIATQHETLKQYREIGTVEELQKIQEFNDSYYKAGYNKAIDEFFDELCKASESVRPVGWTARYNVVTIDRAYEIAKMMKGEL